MRYLNIENFFPSMKSSYLRCDKGSQLSVGKILVFIQYLTMHKYLATNEKFSKKNNKVFACDHNKAISIKMPL